MAAFSQLAARLELYYDSDDEELLMEAECDREAQGEITDAVYFVVDCSA